MQVTMKDFRNMSNEDQQRYIKVAKILITGAVRVAAKEAKENCTPDEDCGSGSTPDLQ